ncbi:MAG: class I adenylate cyclase [Syntrophales bacterium]
MLLARFLQNKKIYISYNNLRKKAFSQQAPKDSEAILYLLPWLLSVNHRALPGYVKDIVKPFMVYGVDRDKDVLKREPVFKTKFGMKKEGTLLGFPTDLNLIHGIYTIGSVGTISQTSRSDCDIWICINRKAFDEKATMQLSRKVNLIKDWFDEHLKMQVYFFISDLDDIRNCHFGNVSDESSGSAQKNILKEEFYRTSIMICGKIPLWWVCHDDDSPVDYDQLLDEYERDVYGDNDFIDLGDMKPVEQGEYVGAALWQFNKSLTHPLKSIIKMLLLEMLILAPREELLCNQFRHSIFSQGLNPVFTDPSMFTMEAVLRHNEGVDAKTFEFIKKCFYLRYEIKFQSKNVTLKETLAKELFQRYPIAREEIIRLNEFSGWPLHEQMEFGDRVLSLLLKIYKGIVTLQGGASQGIDHQDLTIIGRKLSSCLEKKAHKIPVMHKPIENPDLPMLIFRNEGKRWQVHPHKDPSRFVVASPDIVYCLAYLVWNDIYFSGNVRMSPNPTPVTLKEIMSLAKRIREIFGVFDITTVDFENFLKRERTMKMLVVISFGVPPGKDDRIGFCVLYQNNWGELFEKKIGSPDHLKDFFDAHRVMFAHAEVNYYIQRSSQYYEKIIERTKRSISHIIHPNQI